MESRRISSLRVNLFAESEQSFLAALDEAGISHSRLQMYSSRPQMSGIVEVISALSEAMPWNAIAKVIIAWIDARKSRQIMITIDGNKVIHAKGHAVSEIEKLLPRSDQIAVVDTQKHDQT